MSIELVPLYELSMTAGAIQVVPNGPAGTRMIVPIVEGRVEGERLRGTVLGLTGDWLTISPDGIATLDVRGLVETDDGALIYVSYSGRSDVSAGPGTAPLYGAPLFETGDARYAWLNRVQAIARGTLSSDAAKLDFEVYEVR